MANQRMPFDEVMIVNPVDRDGLPRGVRIMPYEYVQSPGMGWYGEPAPLDGYAEADPYGAYAEPEFAEAEYAEPEYAEPEFAEWGEPEAYGEADPYGFAEFEPVGYYAEELPIGEADLLGGYAEPEYGYGYGYGAAGYAEPGYGYAAGAYAEPEIGYWGEPEYAEFDPVGYAAGYAEPPEMVGYGLDELAEEVPGVGYAEPEYAGYVRDVPPAFNAGCPLPTNVAGLGEPPLDGYVRPTEVSPVCERFTPQPGPTAPLPDQFRPLW